MEKDGKALKVWAWIFIVLTIIAPLFAVGSIICSIKYKKYDEAKGSKLLMIAIIVGVTMFIINFLLLLGIR
ncbi:hypothetical protein N9R04_02920 [Staphylococcus sp. SQ8-PEA]|uniref:Mid2-like cell wall stress sensor domain protein n=1 Tax=Staphylococcus marylandisciuri TaxID=2981529 RepID=A0ABT2QNY3_9STAP|nr:hypothetical protein [Staphylococcus marylandisciuri]MCU5745673.1 hypothetical protein [Staphylococcus marylandisciuri]